MSDRYLVIHGHFYQPPRENPWILAIEPQDSAAPYADWNMRITRECYAPNGLSRLLNSEGLISRLINNYEYLSFNFGPTLLSWMEKAAPDTYRRIIAADRKAAEQRDGHGPALAQVYNHIIMPLANSRDRLTQIRWGLTDFESRFDRRPEGMWLAETAVDLESLKFMSQAGIKFTILAQGQAEAVRPLGGAEQSWQDVSGGCIDPREPYRVFWGPGSGDFIDVFFYDGPVSRAIAFEQLLRDGGSLLKRIEEAFGQDQPDKSPRLVNLATDGESYGHHFAFGDMALAWLFDHLEEKKGEPGAIKLTNYGQYLALFPPKKEARLHENSSWSCVHGVERWRSDCGCNTGGGAGRWNQKWRKPLREGFNWLRDRLAETFESVGGQYLQDPWAARDDYLRVIISGYFDEVREDFIQRHRWRELDDLETGCVLSLLESQLMAMYMFTSCGWFFDEVSGLEPVQNMRYALRAIELAQPYTQEGDLSAGLADYLRQIAPNDKSYASGLDIWRKEVLPDSLSGRTLAAHWAAASILNVPEMLNFFTVPDFNKQKATRLQGDDLELLAARLDIYDRRLAKSEELLCLAVHSGGTHLAILAGENQGPAPDWLDEKILREFLGDSLTASASLNIWDLVLKLMPLTSRYVLEDLLPHCRSLLLTVMVDEVYGDLKSYTRDLFHMNQHLLMMNRVSGQAPDWVERFIFRVMGEGELQRILGPVEFGRPINLVSLETLLNKGGLVGLSREESIVEKLGGAFLKKSFDALEEGQAPRRLLADLAAFIRLVGENGFHMDLWEAQNRWYKLHNSDWPADLSDEEKTLMNDLGLILGFQAG